MLERTNGAEATSTRVDAEATPEDNYDPRWVEYNRRNPHQRRSVGAKAAAEGGAGGDGEGGGAAAEAAAAAAAVAEAAKKNGEGGGGGGEGEGEGGQKPGAHFSDAYPEEIKVIAKRYNSEADMAAALKAANTELSQRVAIPGKDADEKTIAAFRKAAGVPDDVAGYNVQRPEFLSEEAYADPKIQAAVTAVVSAMHTAGAPKTIVDAALAAYWANEKAVADQTVKDDKEAEDAAETALRQKWGKNYDANKGFADAANEDFPELAGLELKDGTLVGSSVFFVELLSTMGRLQGEGPARAGFLASEAGVDLKTRFDELTAEINTAYNSGDKAKAQRLDTERSEISKKLFGENQISGQQM